MDTCKSFLMDNERGLWVEGWSSIPYELQHKGNQATAACDLFNLLSQYKDLWQKHFTWLPLLEAGRGSGGLM